MACRNDKTGHQKRCQRSKDPKSFSSVFDCSCSNSLSLRGVARRGNMGDSSPTVVGKVCILFRLTRYAQFTKKHSLSLSLNHGRKKSQPTATWDENQLISKVCENNLSGYNIYNIFITLHLRGEPKRSPHTEILNRMQNIWFGAYFSMIYIFNCPESPREIRTH